MEAIQMLVDEHDVIERVLDLLEKAVTRIESGGTTPDGFDTWAVGFFRLYADRCHHGKEEDILFPLLEEKGIAREGGPIGVMLQEHDLGRACVGRMDQAATASPKDGAGFSVAAKEFIPLLRQHIFKENNVLFPMAKQRMDEKDAADTLEKFRAVEEEKGGPEFHERYEAEVGRWEAEFR